MSQSVIKKPILIEKVITSGSANDLTTLGMYWLNGNGISDIPESYAMLVVLKVTEASVIMQILFRPDYFYMRRCSNGTWTSWLKFLPSA